MAQPHRRASIPPKRRVATARAVHTVRVLEDGRRRLREAFTRVPFDDEATFRAFCDTWIDMLFALARRVESEEAEELTARTMLACLAEAIELRFGT